MKRQNLFVLCGLLFNITVLRADVEPVLKQFTPKENVFLPSGTILRGTIMGAIFSYNVMVPILIALDEAAICPKNNYVVFPKGTQFLGWASVLKSDDRINISVYRAVLPAPSGQEYPVNGIVLYPDGTAGVTGIRKTYTKLKFMSSAAAGALAGVGEVVAASGGASPIAAGAIGGVVKTESEDIGAMAGKTVDVSITVPPRQKISIFLLDRVVFDGQTPVNIGGGK